MSQKLRPAFSLKNKNQTQSIRLTKDISAAVTILESRLRNFDLRLLLVRRCEVLAPKRFTLPEPVTEKRFLALELVFTFGIIVVFKNGTQR